MFSSITFILLGLFFFGLYFWGQNKFSPDKLLLGLWAVAIAIAQWRLSPYELPWSGKFWLLLILFFGLFYAAKKFFDKFFSRRLSAGGEEWQLNNKLFLYLLALMSALALIANAYIFARFHTLPILSSIPDKMRFIINREVFGVWEYLALLPRLFIPLSFIYLLKTATTKKWPKILAVLNIVFGFLLLSLYASRLVIIFAVLLCYFSYLILSAKKINFKKIMAASALTAVVVLAVSVAIPAFRQFITYRDYYSDIDYSPFTYLADISHINIPAWLHWSIPLYLIPSFNLQALARAVDFFHFGNFYLGAYHLSTFDPLLKIFHLPLFNVAVPWSAIFLNWWVTATFLFGYFADFGWLGIILAAVFWGGLISGVYAWATKKPSLVSVLFFAYLSFMVIMTIYTDYFIRPEFYLDFVVIFGLGIILKFFPLSPYSH